MTLPFIKMHGLGNDFVIFDARTQPLKLDREQARHVANRRYGVGCDQVIVMEQSSAADAFMRIYNPDGSEAASCGNAARCVAWLLAQEKKTERVSVETLAGILSAEVVKQKQMKVDMGEPKLGWRDIPLAAECDTLKLDIQEEGLSSPTAVSMGNPHLIFTVPDIDAVDVARLGVLLEHHPLFPERANVSFAKPVSRSYIMLRVWERGAGQTLACGTAACATLVGLSRLGMVGRAADVDLPGGRLFIEWDEATNRVFMTGAVETGFRGTIEL